MISEPEAKMLAHIIAREGYKPHDWITRAAMGVMRAASLVVLREDGAYHASERGREALTEWEAAHARRPRQA